MKNARLILGKEEYEFPTLLGSEDELAIDFTKLRAKTGAITYDPADPAVFKADVTIQAKSINTKAAKRDDHLRSADFFDVEKHPAITFTTIKLDKQDGQMVLTGSLTMKGVAKEVSIPVTIAGPVQGGSIIGLSGSFTLNRQDYGINWNKALDNGGLAVSDEVKLDVNIEAHK